MVSNIKLVRRIYPEHEYWYPDRRLDGDIFPKNTEEHIPRSTIWIQKPKKTFIENDVLLDILKAKISGEEAETSQLK